MGREPQQQSDAQAGTGTAVTAEDVAAFLTAHPDFLSQHPELVLRQTPPPADRGDGVVDLRSFMVERLRAEVDRLKRNQNALVHTARVNHHVRNRVHAAVLALLEAPTLEHLIETVTTDLTVLLDVDVTALLVESNGSDIPQVLRSGVRVVPPGTVRERLAGCPVRLDGDTMGEEGIFGPAAGLVRSQALVRVDVSSETPPCLLALGSRAPDMFHAGMRTELMAFLARVLERCIRSWLDLPA
jgi:hypothetical protein